VWIEGSATMTIVTSTVSMNVPRQTASKASALRGWVGDGNMQLSYHRILV